MFDINFGFKIMKTAFHNLVTLSRWSILLFIFLSIVRFISVYEGVVFYKSEFFFWWLWKWVVKCWTVICGKYLCNLFFICFINKPSFYLMTFKIFSIKKFLQYYLQVFKKWIFFLILQTFTFFFILTNWKQWNIIL